MLPMVLSFVIFSPLIGIILLLLFSNKLHVPKLFTASTLLSLGVTVFLIFNFNFKDTSLQFAQSVTWFKFSLSPDQALTINYSTALDGLSLVFLTLTAIVFVIASLLPKNGDTKLFSILMLWNQIGIFGLFTATDFFLFFVFFELSLVSTYFLIRLWSNRKVALSFLIYNAVGSILMFLCLVGFILIIGNLQFADLQTNLSQISVNLTSLDFKLQMIIWTLFALLMLSLAIKLPMFPFHSWMVKVHKEADFGVVIVHSALLLKIATYGFIRFGLGFFSELMSKVSLAGGILATIGVIYGALLAYRSNQIREILAYASVSHMSLVLLGIFSMNYMGVQGALYLSIAHSLISVLFFYLVALLHQRTNTTNLIELEGIVKADPKFFGFFVFASMSLLGLPGLAGFFGELFILIGAFRSYKILATICCASIILAALYALKIIMSLIFTTNNKEYTSWTPIKRYEYCCVIVVSFLIVILGIYPAIINSPISLTIQSIVGGGS